MTIPKYPKCQVPSTSSAANVVNEFSTLNAVLLGQVSTQVPHTLFIGGACDGRSSAASRTTLVGEGCVMRNKPGPRKKPGLRYPSGDLKPVIPPALWARIRDLGDPPLRSELGRLYLHGEFTETQTNAGFLIADVYRCGESAERGDATTADRRGGLCTVPGDRIALDHLLSEYPPKLRKAVIKLCVFDQAVERTLYAEIGRLLDCASALWPDERQASNGSKSRRRNILREALHRLLTPRRRAADIKAPEGTELRSDFDADAADIEAVKKVLAKWLPDLDADGMARLIDEWVTLRDREVFRQEKKLARQPGESPRS
jgi:hypothetical protein